MIPAQLFVSRIFLHDTYMCQLTKPHATYTSVATRYLSNSSLCPLPPCPPPPFHTTRAVEQKKKNRLPVPTALRLEQPGPAQVVAAAAAAAAGATAVSGFFATKKGGRKATTATADAAAGVTGGGLFARVGARGVLAARLLSDVAAAAVASMMVSPFISIVDRAIIQSASGTMGMQASVAQGFRVLATKPALFLARPDFVCTFCLYGATCKIFLFCFVFMGVDSGWCLLLAPVADVHVVVLVVLFLVFIRRTPRVPPLFMYPGARRSALCCLSSLFYFHPRHT